MNRSRQREPRPVGASSTDPVVTSPAGTAGSHPQGAPGLQPTSTNTARYP